MTKNKDQIQQGDVLLLRVTRLPEGCKRRDSRTVALGEHTGHHHTFDDGVAIMDAPDGRVFVVNENDVPTPLTHQEHNPVVAAPKETYAFGLVQEKDWFRDMVAPVRD